MESTHEPIFPIKVYVEVTLGATTIVSPANPPGNQV